MGLPILAADYPAWWTNRHVIVASSVTNDYAAANLGQLKWFATNACDELEQKLVGGADSNVWALVRGFAATNNYRVINLGQLKAVAAPFYDRLIATGYTNAYPWTTNTADDANYAVANLGQLKRVFSFDLGGLPQPGDEDGDGLPDAWELLIVDADPHDGITSIQQVYPGGDFDGDGRTNGQEYTARTDPTSADTVAPTIALTSPATGSRRVWVP